MVEGARLESVYTPKVYRGFESRPLRSETKEKRDENQRVRSYIHQNLFFGNINSLILLNVTCIVILKVHSLHYNDFPYIILIELILNRDEL